MGVIEPLGKQSVEIGAKRKKEKCREQLASFKEKSQYAVAMNKTINPNNIIYPLKPESGTMLKNVLHLLTPLGFRKRSHNLHVKSFNLNYSK